MTERLISLPVRVENGRLVLDQDPREMHLLDDGATGVVVLAASAVSAHTQSALDGAHLLPAGCEVALPFHVSALSAQIVSHLVRLDRQELDEAIWLLPGFSLDCHFAVLTLLEPLRLKINPKRLPGLDRCNCEHSYFDAPLSSLNAAFTEISKLCETHKQSNVGNVFDLALYREDQRWKSLNARRHQVMFHPPAAPATPSLFDK